VPTGETHFELARRSIDPDRPDILPVATQAWTSNPQLTVMASPWSAPAWMKPSGT